MAKRFTDTDKYKKRFIRGLPGPYKLFWDYLYHDCDHAGIWQVDFEVAQIYLGKDMPVSKDEALSLFNKDEERVVVLNGGSKWFIKSFVDFQYGELNPDNRVHHSILTLLKKEGIKGLTRGLQASTDKDKDKDKDKEGKGLPPSLEEVREYCLARKNGINPQFFIDFYSSKDWMIGKNKMKNWKAAIHTWEHRNPITKKSGMNTL